MKRYGITPFVAIVLTCIGAVVVWAAISTVQKERDMKAAPWYRKNRESVNDATNELLYDHGAVGISIDFSEDDKSVWRIKNYRQDADVMWIVIDGIRKNENREVLSKNLFVERDISPNEVRRVEINEPHGKAYSAPESVDIRWSE